MFSFTSTFDIKTGLAIVDSTDKQHCGTWNLENCKVQVFKMKIDGCVFILTVAIVSNIFYDI